MNRTLALVSIAALLAVVPPPARAAATATTSPSAAESATAILEAAAAGAGALGIYRDEGAGDLVIVAPVSALPAVRAIASRSSAPLPVVTVASRFSVEGLSRLRGKIDRLFQVSHRHDTYAEFYDARLDKVVLSSSVRTSEIAAELASDRSSIHFIAGGVTPLSTRWTDNVPFAGGAAVTDGSTTCTLAFLTSGGMVTAGHCWDTVDPEVWSPGSGALMGDIPTRYCGSGNDAALVKHASYAATIFVGGLSSTTTYGIYGAGDPAVGNTYWWSGRVTGENSTTVTSVSASANWGCGAVTGAVAFQNTEKGQCFAQPGDSGSPLYLKQGTALYARGLLLAKDSEYCYALKWSKVSSILGGVTIG